MDPEHESIKKLLRQNLEVARENNKLLKRMQRAAVWGFVFRIIWIAVIIGAPVVIYYYFLQPYIGALGGSFDQLQEALNAVTGFGNVDTSLLQGILENGGETEG